MPAEHRDLIATKKLQSGAKIFFFADGKYKFFPSRTYITMKEKINKKSPMQEDINKVIDEYFDAILKKVGL